MSEPQAMKTELLLFREHPFFYVSLADVAPGMGLLQIHSDWGAYSAFWPAMGCETLRDFLLDASAEYVEGCLARGMRSLGVRKDSEIRLTKFMAQCWPRLIDHLKHKAQP